MFYLIFNQINAAYVVLSKTLTPDFIYNNYREQISYCFIFTWHDDIREAQFFGYGHSSGEKDHVLSPQLFNVAVQQLERHRQTWIEHTSNSYYFLKKKKNRA